MEKTLALSHDQVSPLSILPLTYLWPSGAPFSAPSLSPSVPVTSEPPVSLLLISLLPEQWSWDEEHYHMDAAPLSVQERWVIYTRCVCVCAMKMCIPASLLATDLDCSVPSFKSLVLNWWKGALADSQAVCCGGYRGHQLPYQSLTDLVMLLYLVYCLQIFPVHVYHPPT